MDEVKVIKISVTIEELDKSDDDEDVLDGVATMRDQESPFDDRHSVADDEEGPERPHCGRAGVARDNGALRRFGRHIYEHDDKSHPIMSSMGDGEITIMWGGYGIPRRPKENT